MSAARRPHAPGVRRVVTGLLVIAMAVTLAGCGLLAPLRPEEPREGDMIFSVVFDDALNLPRGAPVKAQGLTVGNVTSITPEDYRARVEVALREGETLPRRTDFRLRYTTALGELYVEATPSGDGPPIEAGDVVDDQRVTVAPTVEDTLASASMLVNGGGLGQIQTIVEELNTALDGRTGQARGLLTETDRFLAEALESTQQIDRVLTSLAGASRMLRRRQTTVDRALTELRPAAKVLADNTDGLVRLLESTDRLAVTTDRLVRRTRDDLRSIVLQLAPPLEEVLANQEQVIDDLGDLNRFSGRLDGAAPTDYLNLYFLLHVDSIDLTLPGQDGDDTEDNEGVPDLPLPELPDPGLPDGLGLPDLTGLAQPGRPDRGVRR